MDYMGLLAKGCELSACLFLGALAVIVLVKIVTNKIDLEWLVSEDNGHASMSRFAAAQWLTGQPMPNPLQLWNVSTVISVTYATRSLSS